MALTRLLMCVYVILKKVDELELKNNNIYQFNTNLEFKLKEI